MRTSLVCMAFWANSRMAFRARGARFLKVTLWVRLCRLIVYRRLMVSGTLAFFSPLIFANRQMVKGEKKASVPDTIKRLYTINLHKRTHKVTFKKRAPRALKAIREFAQKAMHTKDVRIDQKLNQFLWSKGVRNPPFRVRVRLSRRRNEDEDALEKLYTLVEYVPVDDFSGLQTVADAE
eukprot:TRINITY_DN835_c0_g1_i1.p2 TRINITY_DN835_c0_g1~~TRINITY_DN835_c0_g1_i1.p2  ORF type:complete len:179 (-),score=26.07 TRINITY_DN835_c0_g1_i1:164-700(-)